MNIDKVKRITLWVLWIVLGINVGLMWELYNVLQIQSAFISCTPIETDTEHYSE